MTRVYGVLDRPGLVLTYVFGVNSDVEACRIFDDFIHHNSFLQRYSDDYELVLVSEVPDIVDPTVFKSICSVTDRIKRAQAQGFSPEAAQAEGEVFD